jgi:anti-sigma factor RsiW
MRGKLTEQDLTDYALNDGLEARERLYVESMLGASEECRDDVYKMLDMAALLERGFEMESNRTVPRLTKGQRLELFNAKQRLEILPFVRKAAATFSLAACVAFVVGHSAEWQIGRQTQAVAAMTTEAGRMALDAISPDGEDISAYVAPQTLEGDDSALIQTSGDSMPMPVVDAICTPPTAREIVIEAAEGN